MNRRSFLQFLGGTVATAALPRVIYSFPSQIRIGRPARIRFVKVWDAGAGKMLNRIDVLYGYADLSLPQNAERAMNLTIPRERDDEQLSFRIMDGLRLIENHAKVPAYIQNYNGELARPMKRQDENRLRSLQWYEEGLGMVKDPFAKGGMRSFNVVSVSTQRLD